MSRVGKMPIDLPKGVTVTLAPGKAVIKGAKGTLEVPVADGISVNVEKGVVTVTRATEQKRHRSLHGLTRSLIQNAVIGVVEGYTKQLDVVGVGYKAEVKGDQLHLNVGYSHTVQVPIPREISVTCVVTPDKNHRVTVTGCSKQAVGHLAAVIRKVKPPEPYKGKGVRYVGEHIVRKVGKTAGR